MGFFSGLLGAAAPIVGGFLGGPAGAAIGTGLASAVSGQEAEKGAGEANAMNWQQAQMNRDFQATMSNTAYQRATTDMKKAGLNPMLAYSQGGASTPTGGIAPPAINRQAAGTEASLKAASAQQAQAQTKVLDQTAEKTAAETRNLEANTASTIIENNARTGHTNLDPRTRTARDIQFDSQVTKAMADAHLSQKQIELIRETIKNAMATGENIKANTGNTQVDTVLKKLEIPVARNIARYAEHAGMISPALKDVGAIFNSAAQARRLAR